MMNKWEEAAESELIYKICEREEWLGALDVGRYEGAPVDLADGFMHFSTAEQVVETVARHFPGRTNLVLLSVPTAWLGDDLKWEPSRGGALFPHLYAPLPIDAVSAVDDLPLGPNGRHVFPDLGQWT